MYKHQTWWIYDDVDDGDSVDDDDVDDDDDDDDDDNLWYIFGSNCIFFFTKQNLLIGSTSTCWCKMRSYKQSLLFKTGILNFPICSTL